MRSNVLAVLCTLFVAPVWLGAQDVLTAPGPVEKSAKPITPENPIPRRIFSVAPTYPAEARAVEGVAVVNLRVTLERSGRIAEIRRMNNPFVMAAPGTAASPAMLQSVGEALVASAVSALSQWQYDAPADGPISFTVSFNFRPGTETTSTQDSRAGVGGVTGGFVSGSAATSTPWPAAAGAVRVGGAVRAPVQIRRINPVYPPIAQSARVQGVVILEALVGEDGSVRDARVLRSIPLLDQAALDAVRQWMYQPTLLNGTPVPIILTVTVQFTMPPPPPPSPSPQ